MLKGQILKSKRPVEAMDVVLGIVAHKKNTSCAKSSQLGSTVIRGQPCTLAHAFTIPSCHQGVHPLFILRPIERALRHPGRCRGRDSTMGHCNTAIWWPSHPRHTQSRASLCLPHTGPLGQKLHAWPQLQNTTLVCPHICLEAFHCSA